MSRIHRSSVGYGRVRREIEKDAMSDLTNGTTSGLGGYGGKPPKGSRGFTGLLRDIVSKGKEVAINVARVPKKVAGAVASAFQSLTAPRSSDPAVQRPMTKARAAELTAKAARAAEIADRIEAQARQDEEARLLAEKQGEYTRALSQYGDGSLAPLPDSSKYGDNVPLSQEKEDAQIWTLQGNFRRVETSENVYAIAYDIASETLYVQYKHWDPSMPLDAQEGPGAIYAYSPVPLFKARSLFRAQDVSSWIWDNIRVRGTWSQHRTGMQIMTSSQGYLPRRAAMGKNNQEWFIPRQMGLPGGGSMKSSLPLRPAPPMGYDGRPQWSKPDRARPDNGRPKQ